MNYSQDTWLDGHCAADWCLCSRLVSVQQVDLIGLAMCNGSKGTVQQTGVCAEAKPDLNVHVGVSYRSAALELGVDC